MKSAKSVENEAPKKVKEVKKDNAKKEPIKEAQVPIKAKESVSKKPTLSRESSKEIKSKKEVKIDIEPNESPQKNKETIKSPEAGVMMGKPLKELLRECSVEGDDDKKTPKAETEEKPMKNKKVEPAKLSIENELKNEKKNSGTSSEAVPAAAPKLFLLQNLLKKLSIIYRKKRAVK